jgi:hypothetical protein
VAFVREQGYDVVGELDNLLVPDQLPERRRPDSVTDAEVAQVAVELVATMLGDVRDLRHERRRLRAELNVLPAPVTLLKRLRDRTHRVLARRTE